MGHSSDHRAANEMTDDTGFSPLVSWALHDQVQGQEPSAAVWPAIQQRMARERRRHSAMHWATLSATVVAVAFALALSYSYEISGRSIMQSPAAVSPLLVLDPGPSTPVAHAAQAEQSPAPMRQNQLNHDVEWQTIITVAADDAVVDFVPETPPPQRKPPAPRQSQPAIQTSPALLNLVRGARSQPL